MARKKPKDFTTIALRKEEYKKLSKYREYDGQPMWVVIKKFIEEKEEQKCKN
jgi:hypothetical protein